jgi:hypothetical protein
MDSETLAKITTVQDVNRTASVLFLSSALPPSSAVLYNTED